MKLAHRYLAKVYRRWLQHEMDRLGVLLLLARHRLRDFIRQFVFFIVFIFLIFFYFRELVWSHKHAGLTITRQKWWRKKERERERTRTVGLCSCNASLEQHRLECSQHWHDVAKLLCAWNDRFLFIARIYSVDNLFVVSVSKLNIKYSSSHCHYHHHFLAPNTDGVKYVCHGSNRFGVHTKKTSNLRKLIANDSPNREKLSTNHSTQLMSYMQTTARLTLDCCCCCVLPSEFHTKIAKHSTQLKCTKSTKSTTPQSTSLTYKLNIIENRNENCSLNKQQHEKQRKL